MDTPPLTILQRVLRGVFSILRPENAAQAEAADHLRQCLQYLATELDWPAWSPHRIGNSATGDLLVKLVSVKSPARCLAIGRCLIDTSPLTIAAEPELPRVLLSPTARIQREAQAYRTLSAAGLTPTLLYTDSRCLVNEYINAERLSDVLRRDPSQLWFWLPRILDLISQMHQLNECHLDLNCGNILVRRESSGVQLIDFEYGAAPAVELSHTQAFDYVRFLHGILKRRRGLNAIQSDPSRFLQVCRKHIPDDKWDAALSFPAAVLGRTLQYSALFKK